jgi:glucan phosphoethanolaminetransferase (alkaline phosphatase superfamily)
MNIERLLRAIAGFFILVSVLLAYYHSPYWLFFTAFVGLNLFQSAFTNWCPMMFIMQKLGVKN